MNQLKALVKFYGEDFKEYRDDFVWKTMAGERFSVSDMETSHIFNSAKMIFNHLAEAHNVKPIWFAKRYAPYDKLARDYPGSLVKTLAVFLSELSERGDVPEKYKKAYAHILKRLDFLRRLQKKYDFVDQPKRRSSVEVRDAVSKFLGPTLGGWIDANMDGENGLDIFELDFQDDWAWGNDE